MLRIVNFVNKGVHPFKNYSSWSAIGLSIKRGLFADRLMAINSMKSGYLITTLMLLICFVDYLGADSLMTSLTLCCLILSLCCLKDQTVSSFSTKNTMFVTANKR